MWLPEPLKKFFNDVLESMLKPIADWFMGLPPLKRFIVGFGIVVIGFGVYYHKNVWDFAQVSREFYRAATISPKESFFNSNRDLRLKKLINNIEGDLLDSEYPKKKVSPGDYNPWTISQIVVSCKSDKTTTLMNDYCFYVNHSHALISACDCWSEFENVGYPNYVATSWIMLSMADYKRKLSNKLIDYISQNQNIAGWWSLFPSSRYEDASTLATAWLIFSLNKNLNSGNINKEKEEEAKQSITNGLTWLKAQLDSSKNSWFDYPGSTNERKVSVSINGLILFVINQVDSDTDAKEAFNKQWLEQFDSYLQLTKSNGLLNINSSTTSGHTIELPGKEFTHDNIACYDLPWLIIGGVTAFDNASISTKAKLLSFFNEVVDHGSTLFSNSMNPRPQPWLASEYLFSLRMLNRENFF